MTGISYRDARKEDAWDISGFFMAAWPVEEFLKMSDSLTVSGLRDMVRGYAEAEDTLYSYRNTIVAECDGRVVGAICGYDGADFRRLKRPVTEDLRSRFGEVAYASSEETGPGEFYLDSIGVDSDMRSHGIGSGLFSAMVARAAGLGHATVGLLVDDDNPRAEKLYARLGFRTVGKVDFLGHMMKHMQAETASFGK